MHSIAHAGRHSYSERAWKALHKSCPVFLRNCLHPSQYSLYRCAAVAQGDERQGTVRNLAQSDICSFGRLETVSDQIPPEQRSRTHVTSRYKDCGRNSKLLE